MDEAQLHHGFAGEDEEDRAQKASPISLAVTVSKYATAPSTFWGAFFSLTLVATFAMPARRLLESRAEAE